MSAITSPCAICGKECEMIDLYSRYTHENNTYKMVSVCRECAAKFPTNKVETPAKKRTSRKRKTTTSKAQ